MNKTGEKPGRKGNKNKREIKMAAVSASRFALFKSRFLWRHLSYPPCQPAIPNYGTRLCERIKQAAASSFCSKEKQSREKE